MIRLRPCAIIVAAALVFASPETAHADEWNERTILTFSSPVMIPGATLQPGSYVFELARTGSSGRHTIRVRGQGNQEGTVVTTLAVPLKRPDPKGDVVLKLNPTDSGAPPALKAWFYPGSTYGHEFVYPEEQAKLIANRTKTLVLSIDVPGSDLKKGVLRTHDPSGGSTEWRADAATLKECEAWSSRQAIDDEDREERRTGTTPMIRGDFKGTRVTLDDLESNPSKYLNQTISVDAEVDLLMLPLEPSSIGGIKGPPTVVP